MKSIKLLFWIIVAVLVGALFLIVANHIIVNLTPVEVTVV
jgi:hypothetical protein